MRSNVDVHVDEISTAHHVAFCSVEQRLFGVCGRTSPSQELVWYAEQALAPLIGLGLTPLITVRSNGPKRSRVRDGGSIMDWLPRLWRWLGHPLSPLGFQSVLLAHDPFRWRRAITSSYTP